MINRPSYIEALRPFLDVPLVKILAGVRRCGKSTIFEMLRRELLRRGVPEERIISKSYTEMDVPDNISAKEMYEELTAAMEGKGHCYLLLDEIQEIKNWEKAVNSLLENTDADIYKRHWGRFSVLFRNKRINMTKNRPLSFLAKNKSTEAFLRPLCFFIRRCSCNALPVFGVPGQMRKRSMIF